MPAFEKYGVQGVQKLMAPSIACNNKKTNSDWTKVREVVLAPPLGLGGGVSYGFVLLKNSLDMSGRIFTAALLEACSPFDALSPTLPSPSALFHVEVRRDNFAAGHDTNVGNA